MRLDCHQHFWKLSNPFTAWPTPDLTAIYRDFGPGDLQPLLAAGGIEGSILVQAAPSLEETHFLLNLAWRNLGVKGVVGWVDFASADAPEQIARLAIDPLLKGLRPMIQDVAEPGWILQPNFVPAFDAMIAAGLRFDALVRAWQIDDIAELASRYPALSIVLDHAGKPDIAGGALADWAAAIARLAEHHNVSCKLSGLWTEAGADRSLARIKPYVDVLLSSFGPRRLIWGSDWPVLGLAGSYQDWLDQSAQLLDGLSAAEKAAVFGGNGMRFYGLDLDPDPDRAEPEAGQFLLLHPRDNILVCAASAPAGSRVTIDGQSYRLASDVALGHKIARVALAAGDKVLRYGIAIGSITEAVAPGQHVHSHNLKSDYIPAHGREDARNREIRS